MVVFDFVKRELKLEIPVKDIAEVNLYRNALLRVLRKINIDHNDQQLKEDLKAIYTLLSYTKGDVETVNTHLNSYLNIAQSTVCYSLEIQDLALPLIREELKSRKLFYIFGKVGMDDCFFQVHLDFVILDLMGMNDGTDETYAIYDKIVEWHARRIIDSKESIERHAQKVYEKLLEAKKSLPIQKERV